MQKGRCVVYMVGSKFRSPTALGVALKAVVSEDSSVPANFSKANRLLRALGERHFARKKKQRKAKKARVVIDKQSRGHGFETIFPDLTADNYLARQSWPREQRVHLRNGRRGTA